MLAVEGWEDVAAGKRTSLGSLHVLERVFQRTASFDDVEANGLATGSRITYSAVSMLCMLILAAMLGRKLVSATCQNV